MNKVEIVTQDKYEALKLASLIFVKEGNETFITGIIDVFETEIVISQEGTQSEEEEIEQEGGQSTSYSIKAKNFSIKSL